MTTEKIDKNLIKKIKEGFKNEAALDSVLQAVIQSARENNVLNGSPFRVAEILKEFGADEETIISGIVQFLPKQQMNQLKLSAQEKNEIKAILKKLKRLENLLASREFKLKPIKYWQKNSLDSQATNLRKLFFVLTKDLRPLFIILANQLDKMRNLNEFSEEEKKRLALETMEIFSPLAYGLGMGKVKGELEDLAFPTLHPKQYNWLVENVKEKYEERKEYTEKIKPIVEKLIKGEKIEIIDIHARAKHYFSLYQKLLRYNMDIEKIYDLVAVRIIVKRIEDCYKVLGIIHKKWSPLPGRIKDYISAPKPNGYQSLHTSVYCEKEKITEFQIKTLEMHREAEYGNAAHLAYKEKVPKNIYKKQSWWLDQLKRLKEETKDYKEITKNIDFDLFKDRIFVLTPKGDIIDLPKGATPIDFAYALHTEIGDHCQGVKINGAISSLKKPLENGQIVEVITDKNKTPSLDWLKFVKTQRARAKIKSFLQKTYGIYPIQPKKEIIKEKVLVIKKIFTPKKKKSKSPVLIAGQEQISIKFAKCCQPKPGDKILAFITKGEGASIHRADCENLKYLKEKWPQRIVEAKWNVSPEENKDKNNKPKKKIKALK